MRRNDWTHFAILLVLILWIASAHHITRIHTDAPALGWLTATRLGVLVAIAPVSSIVRWLALLPALIVGAKAADSGYTRRLVSALGVTFALMIAMDMVIGPAAFRALRHEARATPAAFPTYAFDTTFVTRSPIDSLGAIRAGVRVLRTQPDALREPLGEKWDSDHPRMVATDAAMFVPTLLLPFSVSGILMGVLAWLRRRALFRRSVDARTARTFVTWTLAVLVWGLSGAFVGSSYSVLHQRNYLAPLLSQWPFVILAIIGFRAMRAERAWDEVERRDGLKQPGTNAGAHEATTTGT